MVSNTLRYHLDTPVGLIARPADQPQLQRAAAGPPAETDALDAAVHPGGEPGGVPIGWGIMVSHTGGEFSGGNG